MKKFLLMPLAALALLSGLIVGAEPQTKEPPLADAKSLLYEVPNDKAPPKKADVPFGRGFKLPPKNVRDAMHRVSEAKFAHIRKSIPVTTLTVYDARAKGIIPPVGNQRQCGNCYMWSGCKVCSSAQMASNVVPQDGKFMLAPQYGLDCHSNLGGCDGGDEYQVAQLVASNGWPSVAQYGGAGQNPGNCKSTSSMTLYTVTSVVMVGSQSGIAATQDIKNYLAVYGYVSVATDASTNWWNNGTGTCTDTGTSIDHAVGIVGWDDTHDNGDGSKGAWIMQNNWDTSWGSNCANTANPTPTEPGGYGWMKYGSDSIGTEAFIAIAAAGPSPAPTPGPTPPTPVPPVPPGPTPPTPANPIASLTATFADGSEQSFFAITPTTTIADIMSAVAAQNKKAPMPGMKP
jgi:hypothetical protein